MQQITESVRCYSWDKLMCCVNDTGNLVPRRSSWSNLGFMGETFPPSKFTATWYNVNGAACQKMVQSTGMVNQPRDRTTRSSTSRMEANTQVKQVILKNGRVTWVLAESTIWGSVNGCSWMSVNARDQISIATAYLKVPWKYKSVEELGDYVKQIIKISEQHATW
jgi:hypothetical protein